MEVLNLYACLGGNRLFWEDCHVTAVEIDPKLAKIYQDKFPNDTVIVGDAHQYLLDHYKEYDFIWSSPPCPSHSVTNHFLNAQGVIRYPDMMLWQEIIFLKHFYKGKYCVENVISYYTPMFSPQKVGRHYLWANFTIPKIPQPKNDIGTMNRGASLKTQQTASKKTKEERNATNSDLGLHIFNLARNIHIDNNINQGKLF